MSDTATARFNSCDECGENKPAMYEVAMPRPSDPSDMCCIVALCEDCGKGQATGPNAGGGCATVDEWDKAIEAGELKGIYFYT